LRNCERHAPRKRGIQYSAVLRLWLIGPLKRR
jgi:hypothetical protein